MELTRLHWVEDEGVFRRLSHNTDGRRIFGEPIDARNLEPIGDGLEVIGSGRTIREIVQCVYETISEEHPDIEVYGRINAFCMVNLDSIPDDSVFEGLERVAFNFYGLQE